MHCHLSYFNSKFLRTLADATLKRNMLELRTNTTHFELIPGRSTELRSKNKVTFKICVTFSNAPKFLKISVSRTAYFRKHGKERLHLRVSLTCLDAVYKVFLFFCLLCVSMGAEEWIDREAGTVGIMAGILIDNLLTGDCVFCFDRLIGCPIDSCTRWNSLERLFTF